MLRYSAKIEPDTSGFMVSFRDIPEALTGADTREEAEAMAADALLTAMDFYFESAARCRHRQQLRPAKC